MNIEFVLAWGMKKGAWKKAFKHDALAEMVEVYRERTDHFATTTIVLFENVTQALQSVEKKPGIVNWVCDLPRNNRAKNLSSEELAQALAQILNGSISTLRIFIGGPDGWSATDLEKLKAQRVWSFGAMTLTHEMAALIATEQIYRAFTILKGLPYHQGH